jgi:hypothetical protein
MRKNYGILLYPQTNFRMFSQSTVPSDALSFDYAQLPLVVPLRGSKLRVGGASRREASRREVSPVPIQVLKLTSVISGIRLGDEVFIARFED